eukprot:scaffold154049_cov27-Tisochrysis_lutea.AAC.2
MSSLQRNACALTSAAPMTSSMRTVGFAVTATPVVDLGLSADVDTLDCCIDLGLSADDGVLDC